VNKPEVTDVMTDLEKIEKVAEQEHEATEPTENGLDSTCASVPSSPIEKNLATDTMRLVFPVVQLSPLGGAKLSGVHKNVLRLSVVINLQC